MPKLEALVSPAGAGPESEAVVLPAPEVPPTSEALVPHEHETIDFVLMRSNVSRVTSTLSSHQAIVQYVMASERAKLQAELEIAPARNL